MSLRVASYAFNGSVEFESKKIYYAKLYGTP